jgi:hypothetical protein
MGAEVMDLKIMHPGEVAGGMADNTIPGGKLAGPTTTPIPATLVLLVVMATAVGKAMEVGAMAAVAAARATSTAEPEAAEPMAAIAEREVMKQVAVGRAG